jgi:hypothetical protein
MIKISAHLSKKLPIVGTEFSSQNFGAAIEVEVSDADRIQARIGELHALLTAAIDEQINNANERPAGRGHIENPSTVAQQKQFPGSVTNGNGRATGRSQSTTSNRKPIGATEAQGRAIHGICKTLNVDVASLLADYNVTDVSQLSVKTASQIIDQLKSKQNGNGASH